jgi:CubicO group peptidase (beta-lactamase class C family)
MRCDSLYPRNVRAQIVHVLALLKTLFVALALTWFVLALGSRGQAAELSAEIATQLDERIDAFRDKHRVPGISAAVVVGGQLVLERGYGLADVENNVPATPDTVYRLASISKMLTAVAALQLVEQGKLDLQAPVQKYVPDFPEKQAPITCELLLKHQSGIRHYKDGEVRSAVAYARVGDALKIFCDDPLLFAPGEQFSYTTYGYNLLGTAIEAAAGQDYVSYVQEHVCRPAGMKAIEPDSPDKIIAHRAAGYRHKGPGKDAELVNDFFVDVSNKIPGGGWCANSGDLARFAIALMDAKLVSRESLERMWTAQKTASGKQTDSGLGCFVEQVDGQRRISHSGGQPKVSTFLVFSPESHSAVVLMSNLNGARLKALAGELLTLVSQ